MTRPLPGPSNSEIPKRRSAAASRVLRIARNAFPDYAFAAFERPGYFHNVPVGPTKEGSYLKIWLDLSQPVASSLLPCRRVDYISS